MNSEEKMEILDKQKKEVGLTSNDEFEVVLNKLFIEVQNGDNLYYNLKIKGFKNYELVFSLSENIKKELLFYSISLRVSLFQNENNPENGFIKSLFLVELIRILISEISLSDSDVEKLVNIFIANSQNGRIIYKWPVDIFLKQVFKQKGRVSISSNLASSLARLRNKIYYYNDKEEMRIIRKIDCFLSFHSTNDFDLEPVLFLGQDEFSEYISARIKEKDQIERKIWYDMVGLVQKANGSKPKEKFLSEASNFLCEIKTENFQNEIINWFEFIINSKDVISSQQYGMGAFSIYPVNVQAVKGLVWMCSLLNSKKLIYTISNLAERSFRIIPDMGSASPALGKACLYSLSEMKNSKRIG